MSDERFNLDRETNIEKNIDAAGKKWEIFQTRGHPMYFARPNPDRTDAIIPQLLEGQWTNRQLLQEKIDLYLERNWDESELTQKKNARSNQARKEDTLDPVTLSPTELAVENATPSNEQFIEVAAEVLPLLPTEMIAEVPDVAEDMTAEQKEAAIMRAVNAENAAIAAAKEA